jgi:polysaccharide deacetylase 2 family uncharacterized protein YibQ
VVKKKPVKNLGEYCIQYTIHAPLNLLYNQGSWSQGYSEVKKLQVERRADRKAKLHAASCDYTNYQLLENYKSDLYRLFRFEKRSKGIPRRRS